MNSNAANDREMPHAPAEVGPADILAGLRRLGVARGDLLEVHAALGRLGPVEGGADAVIAALLEAVGTEGAVVMPTYPVTPAIPLAEEEQARGLTWKVRVLSFDDRETRTGMGVVSDRFRDWPDAVRSTDSLFSYTAWGIDAAALSANLRPLVERGGKVLLLGVEMDRCSSLHLAEEKVPLPPELQQRFDIPDDVRGDYPVGEWSLGFGPEASPFMVVQREAERRQLIRTTTIGAARVKLFDAKAMVDLYEELLRSNPHRLYAPPD